MTDRICSICGLTKPLTEFGVSSYAKGDGHPIYRWQCKACYTARQRPGSAEWYRKNRERHMAATRERRRKAKESASGIR